MSELALGTIWRIENRSVSNPDHRRASRTDFREAILPAGYLESLYHPRPYEIRPDEGISQNLPFRQNVADEEQEQRERGEGGEGDEPWVF
jgi:hypothetical protein